MLVYGWSRGWFVPIIATLLVLGVVCIVARCVALSRLDDLTIELDPRSAPRFGSSYWSSVDAGWLGGLDSESYADPRLKRAALLAALLTLGPAAFVIAGVVVLFVFSDVPVR